jgi:cobaltochelatase CobN
MHLLAGQPQAVETGEAVDLGQSPGEIVVLSAADSELACLAAARARLGAGFPAVRLASLKSLGHHLSVDLYADAVLARAKLVVVRLLGGAAYWPYGVERLVALARSGGPRLALLPGDDKPDASLEGLSTLPAETLVRLQRFCAEGGVDNAENLLRHSATLIGRDMAWREPATLPTSGLHRPELRESWRDGAPVGALLFYRALSLAGDLEPVDALIDALARRGLNPLPVFVASLREPASAALLAETFAASPPDIVLNATAFAAGGPLPGCDCPVLQVVLAGASEEGWRAGSQGLGPRDLAMHVALPEVDGRVLSRAVSFKAEAHVDALTECPVVRHRAVPDRVEFVAELAANWARLRRKPGAERRVAIVLANYPNREGRVGNGVGLDTPAGVLNALRALRDAGYAVRDLPADGAELIARLQAATDEEFSLADYQISLGALPPAARDKVVARWGRPEDDPGYRPGTLDCGRFAIRAVRFGAALVAVQPSRGYDLDPRATAHDPDLPPPHGYLAFYWFLRWGFRCDAVVHFGKHGNMEWLPGKALALSAECFPEAALGPLPHLYPFIVNDPGEGSQAKRRSAAVIVDHLTPPLARAELYGPLKRLEALVDEYYEAARLDPRRCGPLEKDILTQAAAAGVDVAGDEPLKRIDAQLCELKELQIRDGLHVFGESPQGEQRDALLVALARAPRAGGASLLRALAEDQGLAFDPLAGERDVEALEILALDLVAGRATPAPNWPRTTTVLREIADELKPAVEACGAAELAGLLRGLDGRFVRPGPSGAPTRGRPEVLPTGRNFYTVDTRAVPTAAAWALGCEVGRRMAAGAPSAGRGRRGRARVALSAWGTVQHAHRRRRHRDGAGADRGVRPAWEADHRARSAASEVMSLETCGPARAST